MLKKRGLRMSPLKISSSTPRTFVLMLFVASTTAILSQVYLTPFQGGHLRFGLGPVVFLLLLLIYQLPIIKTTLLTAAMILLSRVLLFYWTGEMAFLEALLYFLPSSLYYIVYGVCFYFVPIKKLQQNTLLLSIVFTAIDFSSNAVEHLLGLLLLNDAPLQLQGMLLLVIIGAFRAFTAIGIYSTTVINMQRKQIEEMLALDSNLYVESLYLQKAMNEIEQVTSRSYNLYRDLQQKNYRTESMQALLLSQEIHEVKKDTERIFAGISKMMMHKEHQQYTLNDVLHFITTANSQYATLLNKAITIEATSNENFAVQRITPLLAIINNLMSNAVEAIDGSGRVTLHVSDDHSFTHFTVIDNGPGISSDALAIIFEPGFTTKFNAEGVAATGIGLSHVQQILERLNGSMTVESNDNETKFIVSIPTIYIKKEG